MLVSSMTGFARKNLDFVIDGTRFSGFWEIKSVNGKSLDVKFKLPSVLEGISKDLREMAATFFSRGNIGVYLELKRETDSKQPKLNESFLTTLLQKAQDIYLLNPDVFAKPQPAALLACPGVMDVVAEVLDEDMLQKVADVLKPEFAALCTDMKLSRQQEGEKIKNALLDIVAKINILAERVWVFAEEIPQKMKAKLQKQLAEWQAETAGISEERLAQELILYVTKADIKEEADRLKVHLQNVVSLLNEGGSIGRKLDFLCQELNREANTTCSKSSEVELTNCAMEIKALIEQLREQVQNIE